MKPLFPVKDWPCTVIFNEACGQALKRLRVKPRHGNFQCAPGQFVMLDLPTSGFHFRRPFSVLSVQEDGSFDLYYKRVGRGTQLMWKLGSGETLNILGPLGNCFETPASPEKTLLIGGGIGIAPLYHWGLVQQTLGNEPGSCFYGVRSASEIGLEDALKQLFGDQFYLATDDGSAGAHGNVCDLLMTQPDRVKHAEQAYVCGPTRMMEAVVQLLHKMNPHLQMRVSLEEHMPCGTGACTGCVVQRTDQALPSKVCAEGPVFDARSIRWNTHLPTESSCQEVPSCPS
ncbi:MAG TPA: dihydroorotate dehydrogenase electron transfer subunit [Oculatellaceae cyanobacterium]|jgi:dihydroorotate dehydrogenase electron transfer subunit